LQAARIIPRKYGPIEVTPHLPVAKGETAECAEHVEGRSMGILPMSVHPAFRGTSAEMPRGRFVRSEPRAIIVPSEHTVTGAGQKGKRNSPEARQPPMGLSCASIEDG